MTDESRPRAISLRQPWWWFVLHGGKDIENRHWATRHRGPTLVHASCWVDDAEVTATLAQIAATIPATWDRLPTVQELRALGGHIVGRVRITDCVRESASPWFVGRYGFVLTEPEAFDRPIACRGARGVFVPTVDIS